MDDIAELNRRLDEHSSMLLKDSVEYARLAREAVDARNAYDLAKAKAQLKVAVEHKEWKVDAQKAQAMIDCNSQMIDARIAEAHLDAMKMRLKAVSESLSAVQTKARLLKTESDLNGYRT